MKYEIWHIVIICLAAFNLILQIVYLILARRRAQKLGILSVKYPIWDKSILLPAILVFLGVFWAIVNAVDLPRDIAKLADYQASFEQDPELYSYSDYIEPAKNRIEQDKFELIFGAAVAVVELLSIFTSGAYITKEGVIFFGNRRLQATEARVEDGAIKFYTRTIREAEKDREYRHSFDMPESENNRELFKNFIKTTGAKA